jgi:hypothetical protein
MSPIVLLHPFRVKRLRADRILANHTFTGMESAVFGAPNPMGLPTSSNTFTILSGTGIFNEASGFATAAGVASPPSGPPGPTQVTPLSFSGSGQITATGLNAVPEPATRALFGTCLAGLVE